MVKIFASLDLFLYIVDIYDFYLPCVSFSNINFKILERQISLNSVITLKTWWSVIPLSAAQFTQIFIFNQIDEQKK